MATKRQEPAPDRAPDLLADRLKALADPVRLRLIGSLLAEPDGELCTCDLAPIVGLSEPTVSHHLRRLSEQGFVAKERRGVNVYYRAVPSALGALGDALTSTLRVDVPAE